MISGVVWLAVLVALMLLRRRTRIRDKPEDLYGLAVAGLPVQIAPPREENFLEKRQ